MGFRTDEIVSTNLIGFPYSFPYKANLKMYNSSLSAKLKTKLK